MPRNKTKKLISIVVPCFNEEDNIKEMYKRLKQTTLGLDSFSFELIFINDGSIDNSEKIILALNKQDKLVKLISFSRNFGHQIAISAGIENAKGEAVIIIDSDLQDPPEILPNLIEKWLKGFDVVYAIRKKRKGESYFKLWTANLFYKLINKISPVKIPLNVGDFRLIDKKVAKSLASIKERNRFVRGLTSWIGFRQTGIYYTRNERFHGKTKYPLFGMLKFAIDGIASFSTFPLRLASIFGFLFVILSLIFIVYALISKYYLRNVLPGWTSIIIIFSFFSGVQFIILGIYGEYIGRIYEEVKARPLYIIKKKIGFK